MLQVTESGWEPCSSRQTSWTGNGGNGEDLFGFGGIGGGHAWPDGNFYSRNVWGAYWSSTETEASPVSANYRQLGIQQTKWPTALIGPLPDAVCVV
jgi:hypothetical protein